MTTIRHVATLAGVLALAACAPPAPEIAGTPRPPTQIVLSTAHRLYHVPITMPACMEAGLRAVQTLGLEVLVQQPPAVAAHQPMGSAGVRIVCVPERNMVFFAATTSPANRPMLEALIRNFHIRQ